MNLPPVLNFQYVNNSGPLAGGMLYSYAAGTTTPQNTYTDQTGSTPNANPVILDSLGSAPVWLDPTLSYKFVLTDSVGNTIFTRDQVVGILTANAVNTASIQNGAVTTAKIASGAITNALLQSDTSIDANRPVGSNNIKSGAVTRDKLSSTFGYLPPTYQSFTTTGAGTYNRTYLFSVSTANATAGATYTNNGVTYTVSQTLTSGVVLQATGSGAPSGTTLTKATGTGDATITFSTFLAPLWIRVRMAGGGGGGSGSGTTAPAGGTGGTTTFGSSFLTCLGGVGGSLNTGGTGGTATIGTGAYGLSIIGNNGTAGGANSTGNGESGSPGGASTIFGGGSGSITGYSAAGTVGAANTGSGGSGGGATAANFGSGGGAGAQIDAIVPNPSATYAFSIGLGGTAGTAGTSGFAGGAGGTGVITVEEHYQ